MLPIYFLSITLNILVGYILAFKNQESEAGGFALNLDSETTRLVIGILAALTGFLKLLSPVSIPIVGDLFPVLTGLWGGFILLFEYYQSKSAVDSPNTENLTIIISKYRHLTGYVCLAAAALHFLFSGVIFL